MDIKYIGQSSFFIRTKAAKIVTDPFDPQMVGLKFPRQEADIVTVSHDHGDHNYLDGIKGEPLVMTWPGEYEKMQVRISGFKSFHDKKEGAERGDNVIFKFEADGLSLLHCGDLGHILSDEIVNQIGAVDILLIPVGGFFTISPEEAVKVINEIEPGMVIPMHYLTPEHDKNRFAELQPVDVFLKEIGAEDVQPVEKVTVKKEELDPENMKVVVLSI